jgi:hypothetical protein
MGSSALRLQRGKVQQSWDKVWLWASLQRHVFRSARPCCAARVYWWMSLVPRGTRLCWRRWGGRSYRTPRLPQSPASSCGQTIIFVALQRHNTENSRKIFPEKELRGLSPDFHIHMSVSELYITMIGLHILLQVHMWTDPRNIKFAHRHMTRLWKLGLRPRNSFSRNT